MDDQQRQCANCGETVSTKYCGYCGQIAPKTLRFRDTLLPLFQAITSWESPFWHTTKSLIANPGKTAADYIAGKRGKLVNPVSFAFWLVTLFTLSASLLDVSLTEHLEMGDDTRESLALYIKFFENSVVYFVFIYSAVSSFFIKWVYKQSEYTAADYYFASLYWAGLFYLFQLPFLLVDFLSGIVQLILMIAYFCFFVFALAGMHSNIHGAQHYTKAILATVIFNIFAFIGVSVGAMIITIGYLEFAS